MQKNAFGGRAPPVPAGGAYSAPQTPYLDLKGPTSKGGQARSYVQARGSSCLLVPRRLNFFETNECNEKLCKKKKIWQKELYKPVAVAVRLRSTPIL